ncbi:hypothetical protein LMG23992_01954 [Cupriavidus laharis]|uniref:ABC transporter substrate-binding protein n=1 Tax=Cupriavidus laharis TaxID=151654 RepID=A0ABN7YGK1_9BURK|nr:tripartite tricarboxylate transporter substrate-binding protein [Cupriavidus laharis]CAG9171180.1 hypothetical protein LMG23992_01954 [Cupriavidus laharis]
MRPHRRQFLATAVASSACALAGPLARASNGQVIRIVVGFTAGGAVDVVARALAEGMRASGYTAVVENKAGASGQLASDAVAAVPADGATLLFTPATSLTLYPHTAKDLRTQVKDFIALGSACEFDFGMAVAQSCPARTLKDFLAVAKRDSRFGAYGTPGTGTAMHFLGAMLAKASGVPLTHIPYKGGSAAMTDAIGGTVPSLITTLPNLVPAHESGKLRILASTADKRAPDLPEVPTFAELGFPGLSITDYFAVFARTGTPPDASAKLSAAVAASATRPAFIATLQKLGYRPNDISVDALRARIARDQARWASIVKSSGYTRDA